MQIIEFPTAQAASHFAEELGLDSEFCLVFYDIAPYEAWLLVFGQCDICGVEQRSFIPARAYENGVIGCECSECGSMAIYPKEGNLEDIKEQEDV